MTMAQPATVMDAAPPVHPLQLHAHSGSGPAAGPPPSHAAHPHTSPSPGGSSLHFQPGRSAAAAAAAAGWGSYGSDPGRYDSSHLIAAAAGMDPAATTPCSSGSPTAGGGHLGVRANGQVDSGALGGMVSAAAASSFFAAQQEASRYYQMHQAYENAAQQGRSSEQMG